MSIDYGRNDVVFDPHTVEASHIVFVQFSHDRTPRASVPIAELELLGAPHMLHHQTGGSGLAAIDTGVGREELVPLRFDLLTP